MVNNFNQLHKLCLENNIPIVRDNTIKLIQDLIKKNKYQNILEIGTAYGYSTYLISKVSSVNKIISLEKNIDNYLIASKFLANNSKIQLININAFEYLPQTKFDFIFIDGPKSNQIKLITQLMKYLNMNGMIFIDNLYLKKFRDLPINNRTKKQQRLINKLDELIQWLKNLNQCNFDLIDIDDGIGILKFKHETRSN